jgi:hypothetical protein
MTKFELLCVQCGRPHPALTTLLGLRDRGRERIILASAGNTVNFTGGGFDRLRRDFDCRTLEPDLWIDESSLDSFTAVL